LERKSSKSQLPAGYPIRRMWISVAIRDAIDILRCPLGNPRFVASST
jgi:hypothetical protein